MNRYYKNCQGILVLLAGFAGFMLPGAAADLPCISAADGFQGFLGGKNAKSWVGKSGLVVTEMERDPQLKFRIRTSSRLLPIGWSSSIGQKVRLVRQENFIIPMERRISPINGGGFLMRFKQMECGMR